MPLSLPRSKINDLVIDLSIHDLNCNLKKIIIYQDCHKGNIHDIKLEFKDYNLHFQLSHQEILDYLVKNSILSFLSLDQNKYLSSHYNYQNGFQSDNN